MRTVSELRADGWKGLVKELGLADALRYRMLFEQGQGDYVKERRELFDDLSLRDCLQAIQEWESRHPS